MFLVRMARTCYIHTYLCKKHMAPVIIASSWAIHRSLPSIWANSRAIYYTNKMLPYKRKARARFKRLKGCRKAAPHFFPATEITLRRLLPERIHVFKCFSLCAREPHFRLPVTLCCTLHVCSLFFLMRGNRAVFLQASCHHLCLSTTLRLQASMPCRLPYSCTYRPPQRPTGSACDG